MIINYITIAWRNLKISKLYSVLNLMGLAIGISSFLIISIYISFENSYDNYHQDIDQLFRVENNRMYSDVNDKSAGCPPGIGPELKNQFPEITEYVKLYQTSGATVTYNPQQENSRNDSRTAIVSQKQNRLYYAQSSFFDLFSYSEIEGDGRKALSKPNYGVVTKSTAKKYFGDDDPIGKQLMVKNSYGEQLIEIAAVYKDSPQNTHLKFDMLISFSTLVNINESAGEGRLWGWNAFNTYVKVAPNSDIQLLNSKFKNFVAENEKDKSGYTRELKLEPVKNIHLYSDLRWEFEPNGNSTTIIFLTAIAIFIIVIAWANYINIITAKSLDRAKEVGIRKILGSKKRNLIFQFLAESVINNFIAIFLAIGITEFSLPFFNSFIGKSLSLSMLLDYLPEVIAFIFVGSVLSGIYPAFLLTSFNPISSIKGKIGNTISSGKIRKGLVAFQFCLTIILIAGSLIVYEQVSFMRNKDLGIDTEQILIVKSPVKSKNALVYRDKVLELPSVYKSSISASVPTRGYSNVASQIRAAKSNPEDGTRCQFIDIDQHYFDLYDVPMAAGVNFNENHKWNNDIILNETACKTFGFKSPEEAIGEKVILGGFGGEIVKVVGVVKDYHHESLQKAILPIIYNPLEWIGYYSLKVESKNISKTIADVHSIWDNTFVGEPFEYFFLDELFNNKYKSEENFEELISIFTSLAIFISCLGLFGLIAHNLERRRKEIGIRKVIGARSSNIITLVSKEFSKSIAISFILSIPVAYYLMNRWLENFAYRIDIGVFPFILSGAIAFMFTFLIVSWQAIKASSANPVESLRTE